jgi:UPF0716 protein FxsA
VFFRLLFLFIALPLVELALLLYLSSLTDWRFTLALVIVTGFVGTWLARSQGFRTYQRIQQELAAGRVPGHSLLDAVMIFVAGVLLLTPGILTDLFGITLLIPACRAYYRKRLASWFKSHFTVRAVPNGAWEDSSGKSEVIDSYVVDRESERADSPRKID